MFRLLLIKFAAVSSIGLVFYGMTQNYWFAGLVLLLVGWGFMRLRQRARENMAENRSSTGVHHHSTESSSSNASGSRADCASDNGSSDSGCGDSGGSSDGGGSSD